MGAESRQCDVHPAFRCIVAADAEKAHDEIPRLCWHLCRCSDMNEIAIFFIRCFSVLLELAVMIFDVVQGRNEHGM